MTTTLPWRQFRVKTIENFAKSSGIKGKFAVIRRGQTFTETVARAEDAGAIGLIVCDHSDGSLVNMMENTSVEIPAIFISKADGDYLVAQESNADASHQVVITDETTFINNPTAGEMSDFSSWGVTPDLKLKPEITGYGGSVYSTLQGGKYGLMSGTSMSSPYLAGVSALVAQRINALKTGTLQYAEETFDFFEKGLAAATIENNHGYGLTNYYLNALPTVAKLTYTEANKKLLVAARASYDSLSDEHKAKVTAKYLDKLTGCEEKWVTLEETAQGKDSPVSAHQPCASPEVLGPYQHVPVQLSEGPSYERGGYQGTAGTGQGNCPERASGRQSWTECRGEGFLRCANKATGCEGFLY